MKHVLNSLPKKDGMQLVQGYPVYTDDLAPQNALIVKVLRSPHAFARIKNIKTDSAKKIPGVVCVLTWKDVPRIPYTRAGQCYPELSAYDKFILDEYVRHVGDDVAIVAAKDEETANKALRLLKVDYEVLTPTLDMEEAVDHKTIVHPEPELFTHINVGCDPKRNIACEVSIELGDMNEAISNSDYVFKARYNTQAQAQAMLESHRSYSYLDQNGRLNVVSSTQIPYHTRRILARALDIPRHQIRVMKPRIGGGFGAKQSAHSEFYPALVTKLTGKPAKIVYSRRDVFRGTTSRHKMRFDITLGMDKDGKINAISMDGLSDTGAYGEHAQTTFGAAGKKVLTLYNKVKASKFSGRVVYSNNVPGGALRGFGVTQGTFAIESAINEACRELGLDPIEVRRMNMIKKGETTPLINMTTKGAGKDPIYMDSCLLETCVDDGLKTFDWKGKRENHVKLNESSHLKYGLGMSIAQQGSGLPNIDMASATIRLNDDGFFTLLTGSTDIGTGSDTAMAQIAAEILDVPLEKIIVHAADTDTTPYDSGAYASSTTYTTGNAVIDAANKMVNAIKETAAGLFESGTDDIEYANEQISCSKTNTVMDLASFSNKIIYNTMHTQLSVTGSFVPKKTAPPYMAGFAEVCVNTLTGETKVTDFVGVVDCGTPINPNLARIQAEGGISQGIGFALIEDVQVSENGTLQTDNFMTYKIPARRDIPKIRVQLAKGYDETGPFGAKSIGEVVINTVAPAITEAIEDAIGVRIRSLPATPEKVLLASLKGVRATEENIETSSPC